MKPMPTLIIGLLLLPLPAVEHDTFYSTDAYAARAVDRTRKIK